MILSQSMIELNFNHVVSTMRSALRLQKGIRDKKILTQIS